jgi:hypothetical protein
MKALTANRLSDGEVVFWKAGTWVERLAEAERVERVQVEQHQNRLRCFDVSSLAADRLRTA